MYEPGDLSHDFLDAEPAGVEHDCVGGRLQRAVRARGVALVAHGLLGEHGLEVGTELDGAPARALARVGGEEHLQLGVGRDDGADVAPLGDPVAVGDQLALLGDERLAHGGVGGNDGGCLVRHRALRMALADVAAVEQHHAATPPCAAPGAAPRSSIVSARASAPSVPCRSGSSPPPRSSAASATQRYMAPLSR